MHRVVRARACKSGCGGLPGGRQGRAAFQGWHRHHLRIRHVSVPPPPSQLVMHHDVSVLIHLERSRPGIVGQEQQPRRRHLLRLQLWYTSCSTCAYTTLVVVISRREAAVPPCKGTGNHPKPRHSLGLCAGLPAAAGCRLPAANRHSGTPGGSSCESLPPRPAQRVYARRPLQPHKYPGGMTGRGRLPRHLGPAPAQTTPSAGFEARWHTILRLGRQEKRSAGRQTTAVGGGY